jgi:hypothetical protein
MKLAEELKITTIAKMLLPKQEFIIEAQHHVLVNELA